MYIHVGLLLAYNVKDYIYIYIIIWPIIERMEDVVADPKHSGVRMMCVFVLNGIHKNLPGACKQQPILTLG